MNDNLPEINFKEKKEKKKGLLGWLKNRLGFGSRSAMGEAGINPSAMNVGRAMGTAQFGASAGLGSFLAGNMATIATVAIIAVAGGMYLVRNAPAPAASSAAFSSNKTPDNYVPAILRSQAANQGSSLDMFKETNKSAGLAMEETVKDAKPAEAKAEASAEAKPDTDQPAPDQANMAQAIAGKLQGGNIGALSTSLGGDSNKMSAMGGFGNKFGQGVTNGFSNGIGTGFQGMPKLGKGKMLAMKASSRPIFSSSQAGKKSKFGSGAFGQAKGLRDTQKTYSGTSIDTARSTQDKAWEGTTGSGSAAGGAGISDGGAGIVTSPSLDNGSGSTGGGSGGTSNDPTVPDASSSSNVSPWSTLVTMIMMMVMASAMLSFIATKLDDSKQIWNICIAKILAGIAIALAGVALAMSVMLMAQYGQKLMGALYLVGSGLAMAAGIAALMGIGQGKAIASGSQYNFNGNNTIVMWLAAGSAIIGLMGSMMGGK